MTRQLHAVDNDRSFKESGESSAPRSALTRSLHTERLTLRPATASDAGDTFEYRRLDPVGQWLNEIPTDLASYQATFIDPARMDATVILERKNVTIGDFMLRIEDAWAQAEVADQARGRQAELGWVLDPSQTGRGYATGALLELLRYCFEELAIRRVVANCFTDNTASWRLMERLGMRREAHSLRDSLHRSGRWLDGFAYSLPAHIVRCQGSIRDASGLTSARCAAER